MPEYLRFQACSDGAYEVLTLNGRVYLGEVTRDDAGGWIFWPSGRNGGAWTAYLMREIADKMDALPRDNLD